MREYLYRNDLCYLIDQEIYAYDKQAKREGWKLGSLHQEWNKIIHKYQNVVVVAPRDHLKSFFFSEVYPLEQCYEDPSMNVLILGGSDGLAIKRLDNIKRWAKLPRWKKLLVGADIENRKEVKFSNGSTIEVCGFWSRVRGGHFKIIILDDVIDFQVIYSDDFNKKTKERIAMEVLPMAEPYTKIFIIGTIQREGDIYSIDWGEITKGTNRHWVKKVYDAVVDEEKKITLFPEKWPWEALMAKRDEIIKLTGDDKLFKKEYRNMKVSLVGEIVKAEQIRGYDELPSDCWSIEPDGTRRIKIPDFWGWDISVGKDPNKGDYTAGIHFYRSNKGDIFIDKIVRKRIGFDERLKEIEAGGRLYPTAIRIAVEENAFQYDSVQVLKRNTSLPIVGVKTTKNKIEKFNQMLAPLFGNGKVFIKNGIENRQEFINELLSLPRGEYDDMADALCIGLAGLHHVGEPRIIWVENE